MQFAQASYDFIDRIAAMWPVGSVYTSLVNTDPETLFGFGTWQAFASGRCLVGVDAGQSEFDAVEKTGGAKTHTLSANEMPSHTHTQNAHSHGEQAQGGTTANNAGTHLMTSSATGGSLRSAGQSTLSVTATNQNTGGGAAHNNLQPFVTVYFWRRTA